jgi:thioredoxin-like negative regulator of GroEL
MAIQLPRTLTPCLGRRIEVLPQAVIDLQSVGESFLLYLKTDNPICRHFTKVLDNFLHWSNLKGLVVEVNLDTYPFGVRLLEVAIVPQVRVFRYGIEHDRHKGTAGYSQLENFLKLV